MRRAVSAAVWMAALTAGSAATTLAVVRPPASPVTAVADGTMTTTDPGVPLLLPVPAVQARRTGPGQGVHIEVPILLYHYIRDNANPADHVGWGLSTPPSIFKRQIDWLRETGGHAVTLAQVTAALRGGPPLPPRSVVLTFDDGHSDFAARAVPVLVADGFVATVFVNTGLMGRPSYMTAAQVQEVAAAGMVVGDHTVTHADLAALPAASVRSQLEVDRAELHTLLGTDVLDVAYPYGDYNASVVSIVAALGFRDAVTTALGHTEYLAKPFEMPRIRIGGGDTVQSFAFKAGLPAPPPGWVDPFG